MFTCNYFRMVISLVKGLNSRFLMLKLSVLQLTLKKSGLIERKQHREVFNPINRRFKESLSTLESAEIFSKLTKVFQSARSESRSICHQKKR
jgi:hypothetical protein